MGVARETWVTCRQAGRFAAQPVLSSGASLWSAVRGYRPGKLRGDLNAGLTVALVAVPQSLAFASIAGVPLVYGLYTAIVGAIVGSLLTSSRHLAIGPTNTMSLLVSSTLVAAAVPAGGEAAIGVAVMLTLAAGAMQLAFALARMGELVRFVSHSVIVGFSAGAGVLIAVGQVPAFLGISLAGLESEHEGVAEKVDRLIQAVGLNGSAPDWRPIAVGMLSLVVALVCRRVSRRLPAYLLAVVAGAGAVFVLGWDEGELALVGELPSGLPSLVVPPLEWDAYRALLGPALAIALVGMIEAYGIGKTLAAKSGDRIDANQEFFCQGVTNVVGSLFRCIPSTGSFSRSALNHAAGAQTQFAGLLGGVFVAGIFLLLAPLARYIPMTSIAAILFVIAYGLIDLDYVRRIFKSNPADLLVCVGTFAATLTISLEIAVFVGVFLTIALYLQRARQLYITEMVRTPGVPSGFIERELRDDKPQGINSPSGNRDNGDPAGISGAGGDGGIVFLQVEGNLFFAAADDLQDRFNDLLASPVRVVILRLKRTHLVDATIMHVVEQFVGQLREDGRQLILCGLRPRMYDRMRSYGLVDDLGEDNVFVSDGEPFSSAKRAVERARSLVHPAGGGDAEREGEAEAAADTTPKNDSP
ncbi:MAG: SulP family inorganic anion transporter [Planctomycetota bacterium]